MEEAKVKLIYYAGDGYDGVPENGKFEVKANSGCKEFTKLSEARKYFDSLNEAKFLWDVKGMPELLDGYTEAKV